MFLFVVFASLTLTACSADMAIKRVCCWKVEIRPGEDRGRAFQERRELYKVRYWGSSLERSFERSLKVRN